MGKHVRILIIAMISPLLILMLLGRFSYAKGEGEKPRGQIRVVESWRPDVTVLGHNVLQCLFEYALDRNEMVPSLAISRNWIDDTTLELKLRQDVRFSNGEPFDAHAVKFNFDYQHKYLAGLTLDLYFRSVMEVKVVDRYTVRMILEQPDALLLNRIWMLLIGAPQYMEQVGWQQFWRRPIGTGPYALEGDLKNYRNVATGEVYATLVANPDYWKKGHPRIRKIEFVNYSSKEALQALIEGHVDLVTSLIPKDTLKVAKSRLSKVVKGRDDVRYTLGLLNMRSPHTLPLRDLRVRKALNFAINKKEMMRYAFKGNAIEMRGILTEKSGVDLSDTESYRWNIPEARELLKKAGYDQGFKIKLYYAEKDYLIAQVLQRFYTLLKIKTEIKAVSWEWILRHAVYPNIREDCSWKDEDWWIIIHSDPAYVPEVMGGLFEWSFHKGAAWQTFPDWLVEPLDNMYYDILGTRDRQERFQIYKKANEYIADQAFWVFTMTPLTLYGVNRNLNFVPQVSQYLYLDYSTVTNNHWSISKPEGEKQK
jgi:peptide/nickel transport system substrate-binding protein